MIRIYLIHRSFLFCKTKSLYGLGFFFFWVVVFDWFLFFQLFLNVGNTYNEQSSWKTEADVVRVRCQVPTKPLPKGKEWVRRHSKVGWKP